MLNYQKLIKQNKYLLISLLSPFILLLNQDIIHVSSNLITIRQLIIILILSPIIEEIIFREVIYYYFYRLSPKYSLLITNTIFMLIHLKNTTNIIILFGIFVSGLIFNLVYIEKKSIFYPIAIHFWFNLYYVIVLN
jgi:membrane protease YdiL (CAAX protease family)